MVVKFGWKAGSEQYPPHQLLEYAVTAEQAGFDSIDVSDHFHPWSEQGQSLRCSSQIACQHGNCWYGT
jgi:coenzyme F420-dependent glucose-6-phosphate dehydrogenase